jgi:hypothetical protein
MPLFLWLTKKQQNQSQDFSRLQIWNQNQRKKDYLSFQRTLKTFTIDETALSNGEPTLFDQQKQCKGANMVR